MYAAPCPRRRAVSELLIVLASTEAAAPGWAGPSSFSQGGKLDFGRVAKHLGNMASVAAASYGGSAAGKAFGSGLFLQGNGSLALAPGAGQTQTISDVIADQTGVGGIGKDAGAWQLVKNGAGTTILTGANVYSGGTAINAGVLQGNTTSLIGNITNSASLVFDQSSDGSFAGMVSGSGSVTKSGQGSLTITGRNSYTGGTSVTAGMLLLGSSSSLSGAITLNGGLLAANTANAAVGNAISIGSAAGSGFYAARGANLAVNGVVSGGQLVKSGEGDVTLTGPKNTFTGATITGGVLRFNTDANLGRPGDIVINGGSVGSTSATPSGTSIARNLVLLGAGGVDVGNTSLTWSGPISGSGQFVKNGFGELTLTGVNTYSGGTKVSLGNLKIDADAELGKPGTGVNLAGGDLHTTETFATSRPFTLTTTDYKPYIDVDATTTLTLNGTVEGSTLHKDGGGMLVLNNRREHLFENVHRAGPGGRQLEKYSWRHRVSTNRCPPSFGEIRPRGDRDIRRQYHWRRRSPEDGRRISDAERQKRLFRRYICFPWDAAGNVEQSAAQYRQQQSGYLRSELRWDLQRIFERQRWRRHPYQRGSGKSYDDQRWCECGHKRQRRHADPERKTG